MSLKDLKEKYTDLLSDNYLNCSKQDLEEFENYGIVFKSVNRQLY